MSRTARVSIVHTVLVLLLAAASADASECLPLRELNYVAASEVRRHAFEVRDFYFCANEAPAQFQCTCPTATVCEPYESADGRDFGRCGCCPPWVYGVLAVLCALIVVSFAFCLYACMCRGKWWCDGYHPPIVAYAPHRSRPQMIPAGAALPGNLFRGYRSSDFDAGPVLPVPQVQPLRDPRERQQAPLGTPDRDEGGEEREALVVTDADGAAAPNNGEGNGAASAAERAQVPPPLAGADGAADAAAATNAVPVNAVDLDHGDFSDIEMDPMGPGDGGGGGDSEAGSGQGLRRRVPAPARNNSASSSQAGAGSSS